MKQKHSLSAEIYILLARFNFKEIVQKSSRFKVLCGLVRLISKYSLVRMRKKMYKYYARIFLKQFFSILRVQLWSVSILWDWKLLFHVNYFTNLPKILFWNRLCYIILIQVYIIFLMNDSHKLGPGITTYNNYIFQALQQTGYLCFSTISMPVFSTTHDFRQIQSVLSPLMT